MNQQTNNASDTVTMRLTVDVTYSLNGENATEINSLLRRQCERAIGNGLLTGESDAEVESHSVEVTIAPEALSEDELASFMLQRIENSDIQLEDIPNRLARYGLMDPMKFVDEMRERMLNASSVEDFSCDVKVTGTPSEEADANIPGEYSFAVKLARPVALQALTQQEQWEIARNVLDCFHQKIGIDFLDDFQIDVVLPGGQLIHEEETIETGLVKKVDYLG